MRLSVGIIFGLLLSVAALDTTALAQMKADQHIKYEDIIVGSQPAAYWQFDGDSATVGGFKFAKLPGVKSSLGPTTPMFSYFGPENPSLHFGGDKSYLRLVDPGKDSPFDFDSGDSITIEAWVAPTSVNGFAYVIGKGRTWLPGMTKENHNWAMRLKGGGGSAALTFLFRSRATKGDKKSESEYHRWTSSNSLGIGDGWHHVAIAFSFGKKGSLQAWIDGEPTKGKWDLGGDTAKAPVVDDDEVWIGSAMAGSRGSTFNGSIDEVAIYRRRLTTEEIKNRYHYNAPEAKDVVVPARQVLVQVFEGAGGKWRLRNPNPTEEFTTDIFAFPKLPHRYSERGIQVDRKAPMVVRAHADVELPEGLHRILIRAREESRLYVDDKLVAQIEPYTITVEANGPIWDLDRSHAPNIHPLPRGDRQAVVEINGDGQHHRIRFETQVGLRNRRRELGEAVVCIAKADPNSEFEIVSFGPGFELTDSGWAEFSDWHRQNLLETNRKRRNAAAQGEKQYWHQRRRLAKQYLRNIGFEHAGTDQAIQTINRMIDQVADTNQQTSTRTLNDLQFLRRVTLDTIGTVPSANDIRLYLNDPVETRRSSVIDRLLNRPEWADHWVSYWQDVLAENPNIVNPSLNNTGPFRFWIHESFVDNKPFDRFVAELTMMEGAALYGGPGGFALATENDVPMAAKSHVIGQAFLGIQMQCARCHDAPNHDIKQKDLFSLAAMLKRGAQKVPATSSINLPPDDLAHMAVQVTLKPGEAVAPAWSFDKLFTDEISQPFIRNEKDSRERLSVMLTAPQNERFAQSIVNRLWKRYMGLGLVEPVDDWENGTQTHPQLLEWLGRQFVADGYDLKATARLILNSKLYASDSVTDESLAETFDGPLQKQLSAEQLVDSLFHIAGKRFNAGQMAVDIDGARPANLSLNLGRPRKAWMFTSTSNERDRPGLALPFAQPFVNFLQQFGWRGARQNPVNDRPDDLTSLQPAEFLNGTLVKRITRLSDDHVFTSVSMQDQLTVHRLVDELYLRILTRKPTAREREILSKLLAEGFKTRRIPDAPPVSRSIDQRDKISWSNHLEEEATTINMELQDLVRQGDPPTHRLTRQWRERLEDVIWSLLNSPEFRFAP